MTEAEALQDLVSQHQIITEQVTNKSEAMMSAVAAGTPHEAALTELVGYLTTTVLAHILAEEETLYRAARGRAGLAATVEGMLRERDTLRASLVRLAGVPSGPSAMLQAHTAVELLAKQVGQENEILFPALLDDSSVDLVQILQQMHDLMDAAVTAPGAPTDREATLLALLMDAARQLARTGDADHASRLLASAWAELRESRPDLAHRVTAALHEMARVVSAQERGTLDDAAHATGETDIELDVRPFPPAQRHERIVDTYAGLTPGTGFVLVNDHDPKPLRYQFEAENAGAFSWDILESGPDVWRIRIGKTARPRVLSEEGRLDVRALAHAQRHHTIFATYASLAPGMAFVLINDHDPRPLRYQFDAQFPGAFTWEYLEAGPRVWRVRIGKRE